MIRNFKSWFIAASLVLAVGILFSFFSDTNGILNSSKQLTPIKTAESFDFPVGPPDGAGYYNAQGFGKNNHLGDDWNADTGGNTDLGDPFYTIGNGVVSFAEDMKGGWGNVIRVIHLLPNGSKVESLYAHCDKIMVKKGQQIEKGEQLGTIGDAHGSYYAHLHLELRSTIDLPLGGGYSSKTTGYLDPTIFIKNHR